MKVTDTKESAGKKPFCDLGFGTVFEWDDRLYVKIQPQSNGGEHNVFNIKENRTGCVHGNATCVIREAELLLK